MTLIALDSETDADLRDEALDVLEDLLSDARVIQRVESILLAKPMPSEADLSGAIDTCTAGTTPTSHALFVKLKEAQPSFGPLDSRA